MPTGAAQFAATMFAAVVMVAVAAFHLGTGELLWEWTTTDKGAQLVTLLNSVSSRFIRCLKPNPTLVPRVLHGEMVLVQMASSGLLEAVKLMQASYPSRSTYEELLRIFGNQLPKSTQSLPQAQQVHTSTPLLTSTIPTPPTSHTLPPPLPAPVSFVVFGPF